MHGVKTALVTGAAGFIGRHISTELKVRGWSVSAGWDLAYGQDAMDLFRGPYGDRAVGKFDLVVHAAYHVGGRAGIDGQNTNFARNVALDGAMFDWAVRTRQPHVLYFSSSAAYPVLTQTEEWAERRGGRSPLLHEDMIDPNDPALPDAGYGWAKLTGERLAVEARRCGTAVTVVRPFSGYSGTQSTDYPFPAIVDRAIAGAYHVWGPRGQARDWIHVNDVVNACLAIVADGTQDPVNLCTGVSTTMDSLMREAIRQLRTLRPNGYPDPREVDIAHLLDKPTGVFQRVGDPERMFKYYTPRITVEDGVTGALVRRGALQASSASDSARLTF